MKTVIKEKKKISPSDLRAHQANQDIYNATKVDKLAESIAEIGLLQLPIINQSNEVLCGWRRVQATLLLKWEEIEVEVVDVSEEDEAAFIVYSNTHRSKSEVEKYREGQILKSYWAKQQGTRTDLMEGLSEEEKLTTRTRIAQTIGVPETTYHRIETVGNKDIKLLELVDTNQMSLFEAYTACKLDKPVHEKEVEEIDLCEIKNCPFCGNHTARIIEAENGTLTYKIENNE